MMGTSQKSLEKMLARARPIVTRLPAGRPLMVEVGVFTGFMGEWLLDQRPELRWIGIDPWLSAAEQPAAYVATGDVHAVATGHQQAVYEHETRERLARFGDRARIIKEASPFAAKAFGDASVDLVFLDGDHSHEGTFADLQAWWPIVKPGGWLSGHDFNNPDPRFKYGVHLAVEQFSNETLVTYELDDGFTYWFRKAAPLT